MAQFKSVTTSSAWVGRPIADIYSISTLDSGITTPIRSNPRLTTFTGPTSDYYVFSTFVSVITLTNTVASTTSSVGPPSTTIDLTSPPSSVAATRTQEQDPVTPPPSSVAASPTQEQDPVTSPPSSVAAIPTQEQESLTSTSSVAAIPTQGPLTSSSSVAAIPPQQPLNSSSVAAIPAQEPPNSSPSTSTTPKIALGLGIGLGIPLLLLSAGIILLLLRRRRRARTTPVPEAGYSVEDGFSNEKKTGSVISTGGQDPGTPELHGDHVPLYSTELPGTPGPHRSEMP
ncbi:MAG: hypothetical protein L6R35_001417 [Caloplaca aegaea]|nr:MAG: hypothetical protein L6R35_001417 [Caloplaca aegaea]